VVSTPVVDFGILFGSAEDEVWTTETGEMDVAKVELI
jgi:hypothetical protein